METLSRHTELGSWKFRLHQAGVFSLIKGALLLVLVLLLSIPSYSQNQVLGEVQFVGKTKTEKTSGVFF